jgi:phosphatidylglycerol:prolipoprotein diacylglycerol transferase
VTAAARGILQDLNPEIPARFRTFPEIYAAALGSREFNVMLIGTFGLTALLLATDEHVDWAYEISFAALLGGLVGARLYFIVQNYDDVKGDLVGNLFSGAGLVWYGGVIGGTLAVLAWAWYRDFLGLALLDLAAPALALGYAIGRCGCQLSGDGDYGKASDLPWAMAYPHGTVRTTERVQPTPIYETLAMGLVAYLLWRLRDRFQTGVLFAIYLVLAGTERFAVEFIRRNWSVKAIDRMIVVAAMEDPGQQAHERLKQFLGWIKVSRHLRCVTRTGWHQTEAGHVCFVRQRWSCRSLSAAET